MEAKQIYSSSIWGCNLAWYEWGVHEAEDTIIFIHGFLEDSSIWFDFSKKLAEKYRIIAIDMPGFGASTLGNVTTMQDYASAILELITFVNEGRCHSFVVGHSMGGYVCCELLHLSPTAWKGMVMFSTHPFGDDDAKKVARSKQIEFIRNHGVIELAKLITPSLFEAGFAKEHPELINEMIAKASNLEVEHVATALGAMKTRNNNTEILRDAEIPLMIIHGTNDTIITKEQGISQAYLSNISCLHLLHGVGHQGMYEAPEIASEAINEFINVFKGWY
ncbi:MAG: alpha/beta hydrolase [Saprospiraceae bacterium]|nr:alpha/beta hydrolase [Saprospiraceae bacterium]